ncbi:MAG: amidase [Cyanothece sp. SIO1E1]|nr:amidase [Cyanothece sp. SIO1E1]
MFNSIQELSDALRRGQYTPLDLTERYLSRIEQCSDANSIFRLVLAERARIDAIASGERYQTNSILSAIDGIPLAWKDNIKIAGTPTSNGVPKLAETRSTVNAEIYQKGVDLGTICIGKTNMNELAFSGLGVNNNFGTPKNPFDKKFHRIPGGSSSGSAVAVARSLVPAAIGTDTGGSVRIPAAWNNLVGLKTTAGLISTKGIIPLSTSLDTVGFLTNSVSDSALLFEAFCGNKIVDIDALTLEDITLIDCQNVVQNEIDPSVKLIYQRALDTLKKRGAVIKSEVFPEIEKVFDISKNEGNIIAYEARNNWLEFVENNPGAISPEIEDRIKIRMDLTSHDMAIIGAKIASLSKQFLERASEGIAVVMPTVAIVPPKLSYVNASLDNFASTNMMALRNTRIANLLGLCSISLPAGFTSDGFPVGLMLNCPPFHDKNLILAARAIEKSLQEYYRE